MAEAIASRLSAAKHKRAGHGSNCKVNMQVTYIIMQNSCYCLSSLIVPREICDVNSAWIALINTSQTNEQVFRLVFLDVAHESFIPGGARNTTVYKH